MSRSQSQSHSESHNGSTYPNTPTPEEEIGDFAKLVPLNSFALQAFSNLVEKVIHHPEEFEHVAKFIYYEKADDGFYSPLSDEEGTQVEEPKWCGHYRLSFRVLPRFMTTGWTLGTQHIPAKDIGVDFLLAPKGKYRVGTNHARIALNIKSGALMLSATNRSVSIHGSFGPVRLVNCSRALTESTSITIGDLQYDFQFLDIDEKAHRVELQEIIRTRLGNSDFEIPQYLSASGTAHDIQLKDYTVQKAFAEGVSCVVASGFAKDTGECVIVKKVKKTRKNSESVMNEATILEALQEVQRHPRICHLREVIQNSQECKVDEIMFIYEPIMLFSLHDAISLPSLDISDREEVCKQCVEGLAWIHLNGLMHRDIKPGNMGLVSMHPISAIIIDFGHSTFDLVSIDHHKGTIPYLAPEMCDLKCGLGFQKAYTNAVDIWAMGISCYQLLCQRAWQGPEFSKDKAGRYRGHSLIRPMHAVRRHLAASKSKEITEVILKMLEEKPATRISAKDAWAALGKERVDEHPREIVASLAKRPKLEID